MKKGGGSQKGSSFEREICKKLSKWWTDGRRDDIFWRTAGSGARGTNRAKKGQSTAGANGDITFIDPIGKPLLDVCCFELKRGYNPSALDLVDKAYGSRPPLILAFYRQAKRSAEQANVKHALVIFKRDQKRPVLLLTRPFLFELTAYNGEFHAPMLKFDDGRGQKATRLVMVALDEFLNWATPQAITEICNDIKQGSLH